jgi:hypothetical protein
MERFEIEESSVCNFAKLWKTQLAKIIVNQNIMGRQFFVTYVHEIRIV